MADLGGSIFAEKAANKLKSPDDLDKYLRVTNPSIWMALVACCLLLAGLLAWGVFGVINTNVIAAGVREGDTVVAFVDPDLIVGVDTGDTASVHGESMRVAEVSSAPLSREDITKIVKGDYLVSAILEGEWAYKVVLEGDGNYDFSEGVPLTVEINAESIAPLEAVLGSGGNA